MPIEWEAIVLPPCASKSSATRHLATGRQTLDKLLFIATSHEAVIVLAATSQNWEATLCALQHRQASNIQLQRLTTRSRLLSPIMRWKQAKRRWSIHPGPKGSGQWSGQRVHTKRESVKRLPFTGACVHRQRHRANTAELKHAATAIDGCLQLHVCTACTKTC